VGLNAEKLEHGKKYAVKRLTREGLESWFIREDAVCTALGDHENIIKYHGIYMPT
jgi:hypothetical protein